RFSTTSTTEVLRATGRLNRLPAEARTALPPCGSTVFPAKSTPPAPKASATRMMVPALPGSFVSTGTAISGLFLTALAMRVPSSTIWFAQRANRPVWVTVSERWSAARSVMRWTWVPVTSWRKGKRSHAVSVTYRSRTSPRASAAVTAFSPSARKRPVLRRLAARCSLAALTMRGVRSVNISMASQPSRVAAGQRLWCPATGATFTARLPTRHLSWVSTAAYPAFSPRGVRGVDMKKPPPMRCASKAVGGFTPRGALGSCRCVDVLRQSSLSSLAQCGEGSGVGDSQLGQDLAVDLDLGQLQALDQAVVGHVVLASSGVDALDPQLAELTLAG